MTMTDITIPKEALEAAVSAYRAVPPQMTHVSAIRAACLAAIEAWPGAQDSGLTMGKHSTRIYILPLPTENTDDNG